MKIDYSNLETKLNIKFKDRKLLNVITSEENKILSELDTNNPKSKARPYATNTADQSTKKLCRSNNFNTDQSAEQAQCELPFLSLLSRTDCRTVIDSVGSHFGSCHRAEQAQSQLPLLPLFARTDCRTVTDGVLWALALTIVPRKSNASCHSCPFCHVRIAAL